MKNIDRNKLENIIKREKNILFAYLYGSFLSSGKFNDIDIAVYLKKLSLGYVADLKIKLAEALKAPSDFIDITALNGILNSPDAFSLLYLERVLKQGKLVVSRSDKTYSEFLESYSGRYRASVGLLDEAR